MSLIVAEGISKSYGKVVAVDSLNLSLDKGLCHSSDRTQRGGKNHYNQDDSWFAEAR